MSSSTFLDSAEWIRRAFEAAPMGMAFGDVNARLHFINPAFCQMLGYTYDELMALPQPFPSPPEDAARDIELFTELVNGKRTTYQMEKRYYRKDGSILWGHLTVALVPNANGTPLGVIGIVEDLSERKAAEECLRKTQAQLEQAQRLDAIGRLASGVAHDFNNLLGIIRGYTSLLEEAVAHESRACTYLARIHEATSKSAELVRQLLMFARKQPMNPEVLDIENILRTTCPLLERIAGENIQIRLEIPSKLPPIYADSTHIDQIVMNLVMNARDALPDGGEVVISAAAETLDAVAASDLGVNPGTFVILCVSDKGVGIAPDHLPHIFEPFFTTKNEKGTGLGLSTVYGIVKQTGGAISVSSEPGHGTTFRVYLPTTTKEVRKESIVMAPEREPGTGGTILLVEDNTIMREMVAEVLSAAGYRVLVADGPGIALQYVQEYDGNIDLLLTDVSLPGLTGPQLASKIRQYRETIRILFMSGYSWDALQNMESLLPGVAAKLVEKPFSPALLLRRVEEALEPSREYRLQG